MCDDKTKLFEALCDVKTLTKAAKIVKSNSGAPGIDGVTVSDFDLNLSKEVIQLQEELANWNYKPLPVRRVEIPKPGTKSKRLLGIPCVRDRVVQTALKQLLEPWFEPLFSPNSFGFRPGINQHDAVNRAKDYVKSGKEHVVDIDLEKFFDRINHDRLISRISKVIPDKRILRLIGLTLRTGIMHDGVVRHAEEGSVQGGPLSPLLSNIVLDELDKELESRGLSFCRYADDCNIFVGCYASAQRVMANISKFITRKLKLKINTEKSKIAKSKDVKFLGFTIINKTIAISKKSLKVAMEKVRVLVPRGTSETLEQAIKRINTWYAGWSNYYGRTEYPAQLKKIEAHIRRRLRARIVSQHKRRKFLANKLEAKGVKKQTTSKAVYSNRKVWALSHTVAVERAFPNKWFESLGFKLASNKKKEWWFDINRWIKLT